MKAKPKNDLEFISKFLATFFADKPHMAIVWCFTSNPMFGGVSPAELIVIGKIKKVSKFIEANLSEERH